MLHATTFEVASLNAVVMAPFLLFGLPAGALVERLRMRRVMIATDVARMLVIGSLPVAAALGHLTLAHLYIATFVVGVLTVFFDVSYQSYVPALVPRRQLADANGKLQSTEQVASVAGPAAGGALVAAFGAATALSADAVSYLVSVASLVGVRRPDRNPPPREGADTQGLFGDIGEGLRFVWRQPMLRAIALCTGGVNFATDVAFAVLTVFMVRRLHLTPSHIGLLFALGGVAGFLGALVTTRVIRRVGVGPAVIIGAFGSSLGGVALPIATRGAGTWWIAVGLMTFWFFAVVYNVGQVSLRQAITPSYLLGRMNATMRFMVWGPSPIGALVGGALGTAIGVRPTLWVAAVVGFVPCVVIAASQVRHQREIPDDEPG